MALLFTRRPSRCTPSPVIVIGRLNRALPVVLTTPVTLLVVPSAATVVRLDYLAGQRLLIGTVNVDLKHLHRADQTLGHQDRVEGQRRGPAFCRAIRRPMARAC